MQFHQTSAVSGKAAYLGISIHLRLIKKIDEDLTVFAGIVSRAKVLHVRLFYYVGLVTYFLIRWWRRKTFSKYKVRRILILAVYFGVGNIILLTPLLRSLKKNLPSAYVAVLTRSRSGQDILKSLPFVDNVITFHVPEPISLVKEIRFLRKEVAPQRFDLVIGTCLEALVDMPFWAWATGAPYRITYHQGPARFLNTFTLEADNSKHEVERYLDIARFLAIEANQPDLCLLTSGDDEAFADQFLSRCQETNRGPLIGIHPGAGGTSISSLYEKRWPLERFVILADMLLERYNAKILFIGGPDDQDLWKPAQEMARYDHLFATSQTILQTAALIRRCDLFISNDSGLMHVAAAMKVSTVAIFGPTIPGKNHPWRTKHTLIREDLPCSPCYSWPFEPPCHGKMECLQAISVERVLRAVEEYLD